MDSYRLTELFGKLSDEIISMLQDNTYYSTTWVLYCKSSGCFI